MTLQFADRVWDISSTIGTGSVTLNNTPPNAYRTFGSVCANGDTIFYCIANQISPQFEVGLGTYNTAGPTLSRTTVLASSNSNALVSFTTGPLDVMGVMPANRLLALAPVQVAMRSSAGPTVNLSAVTDYFIALDTVTNSITVNLPASPALGLSFLIKDATGHAGTNNITVAPASGNIDGAASFLMQLNFQSIAVSYNGSQWSVN